MSRLVVPEPPTRSQLPVPGHEITELSRWKRLLLLQPPFHSIPLSLTPGFYPALRATLYFNPHPYSSWQFSAATAIPLSLQRVSTISLSLSLHPSISLCSSSCLSTRPKLCWPEISMKWIRHVAGRRLPLDSIFRVIGLSISAR